ncbi:glycosyltransferase family 2 protein [Clostridium sp. CCUG 7971]|uniref:glycosyltransferase family 2 protein n=1 Tax=Clostridium sp. CCUG 7971 TaxID=2811414 RepID=UPI0025703368|nr:glycosyltransferase family 2 protein [Clostridium sp. CCUG 7971]
MEISLCMIVKDEEEVIERCLNSIKEVVDEIIIVDTGSRDKTINKAKNLGAKVYDFKWVEDFSKARNFAFSKATKDYIIWMDADDVLNKSDIDKFKLLKESIDESIDSVTMNYVLSVNKNGEITSSLKRNRLVKASNNFKWVGKVHEYLDVRGNIIHSDINIIHKKEKEYTNRNLKIYEKLVSTGENFSTRDIFYYANELYDNRLYDDAIKQYIKFLDKKDGWVEDIKAACSKLADCYSYKGDSENELKYILKSFEYDIPRADFCCKLGRKFLNENKLDAAIYWYECAINLSPQKDNMSLINHDMYTFLPMIQLCVCHYRNGNIKKAYLYNEMASKYKPEDVSVKYNKEFFKDKIDRDIIEEVEKLLNTMNKS